MYFILVNVQVVVMQKGERRTVYLDHMAETRPEGEVELLVLIEETPNSEIWKVKFHRHYIHPGDHGIAERRIKK